MNTHDIDTGLPYVAFCRVSDIDPHDSHHRQLGVSADTKLYTEDQLRAAIEADRKRRGEPVAWLRKNGFRFNAEIEPRDDSELPLYTTPQPAEPVKVSDDLAHEIWAAAQTAPGEGIEDAVERVAALLARKEQS